MRIAICDDKAIDRKKLIETIISYEKQIKTTHLEEFSNGTALLHYMQHNSVDLVLLDCNMPIENGIEVARKIRKINEKVLIIAVSDYIDYSIDGYEVDMFRYIIKSELESTLLRVLQTCEEYIHKRDTEFYAYKIAGGGILNILKSDIIYIESKLHSVYLHRANQKEERANKSLNLVQQELSSNAFIRTHKSYLINCRHVSKFEKKYIILNNCRTRLPVSRDFYNSAFENFTSFVTGEM